ncbi:MarR family winged helix-turn-helix transcriptional regulator [Thalassotalea euphylliae]|uniref:MarR family transcriptional regulator n=1 Tax=Thalassotalea euphylliae TaxID=1655234 RepID=A0A3E0UIY4_9GAMM|nr:MarR family transcriptional regulator [Thalassotalea euphylliae]REL35722.1 MarR family transcriptional regulator [Thalassotalea euphylliae]
MSDNLKLEKQLCFRLYSLNKTITKLYSPLLKALGLTYPQYLVMLVMWQAKQSVPIKTLCQQLELDTGTLSPLLKRMEQANLLVRTRSEQDERSVHINLTKKGKQLKQQAAQIPETMFSLTGLSIEEVVNLQQTLDKALNNTKAQLG